MRLELAKGWTRLNHLLHMLFLLIVAYFGHYSLLLTTVGCLLSILLDLDQSLHLVLSMQDFRTLDHVLLQVIKIESSLETLL